MGRSTLAVGGPAADLIDELRSQQRLLGQAQARSAGLMVRFADARSGLDRVAIAEVRALGGKARYKAGEFAATEISLAVHSSKYFAQRTLAMTRRLQRETPDAWDAWQAGDIDYDKALRINRALLRLVDDKNKELLNATVVDVAKNRTPELLGRWLNLFIAKYEPDETNERMRRSFEDRYVSIRPDLDGISFLSAALSAGDAAAVDQILNALAAAAAPDDPRTMSQRRADALVDVLCGRVSNGCHVVWDTNDDGNDDLDDEDDTGEDETDSDPSGSATETNSATSDTGDDETDTQDTHDTHDTHDTQDTQDTQDTDPDQPTVVPPDNGSRPDE